MVLLAQSFGLLKLPKMPEVKGKEGKWEEVEVDVSQNARIFDIDNFLIQTLPFRIQWEQYAYADVVREKQRREEAAAIKASREARLEAGGKRSASDATTTLDLAEPNSKKSKNTKPKQTKAWSQKEEADDKKEARRLKKVKKAKAINGNRLNLDDGDDGEGAQDWKDSIREQKMARKKLKEDGRSMTIGIDLQILFFICFWVNIELSAN